VTVIRGGAATFNKDFMKTKHSITFFSAVRTVISGAARGLSQGAKLNWRVPAGHYREPTSQNSEKSYEMIVNLWMSWTSILAKKTKTPRKMQKKQQPKEY